jgi:curli biogenesis system outer membrane secretion channel CsgG
MLTRKLLLFSFMAVLMIFMLGGLTLAQDESTDTDDDAVATETTTTTTTTTTSTDSSASSTTSTGEATEASGRPRLAVYTFENPPNYYNSTIGDGLTSIIITHLSQSGRFDVIQRGENLDLLIEEIDFGQSGYVEESTAVEMGHILGVEYVLSGRVTNFGYEETSTGGLLGGWGGFGGVDITEEEALVRLDFALIDARTGETVLAATAEGKDSDTDFDVDARNWGDWFGSISYDSDEFMDSMIGKATLKAVDSLMSQILTEFPIQAPVLAVTPNFIILDIGSNAGIEEGMQFEVYRISAVTNSAGEVVWEDKTLIGSVEVTEVELRNCKAVVVSGSDIQEGDLGILVEEPAEE